MPDNATDDFADRHADSAASRPETAPQPVAAGAGPRAGLAARLAGGAILLLGVAVYMIIAQRNIGRAYIDFGDGNYLYIASRIADGLTPYRDIMAPQPPAHLIVGSWLVRLGEAIGVELALVRWFSILLRAATAVVVASIARALTRSFIAGGAAGAIYALLPNGVIWSLGYQSEPLEIFFMTLAVRLLIGMRPWAVSAASGLMAMAVFTNMTAAPYAGLIALWLLFRKRWLLAFLFLAPLIVLTAGGIWAMERWTGGHYLENIFFNQVGTYPKQGLLHYAVFVKLIPESRDVLVLEGVAVLAALAGIAICLWREVRRDRRGGEEFLAWFALAGMGSIVFVSKGGTMEYIFTIGEPYVAIFFAYALWRAARAGANLAGSGGSSPSWMFIGARALWRMAAILLLLGGFAYQSHFTLKHVAAGRICQLSERRMQQIDRLIREYTFARDRILAPPFFAYDTRRLLAGEYSELFIWFIGYMVEQNWQSDESRSPSIVDGPYTRKALEIAQMLDRREIPLAILDAEQTGRIAPIRQAITRRYRPLAARVYMTADTPLEFWIPRQDDDPLQPLAETIDDLYPLAPAEDPLREFVLHDEG